MVRKPSSTSVRPMDGSWIANPESSKDYRAFRIRTAHREQMHLMKKTSHTNTNATWMQTAASDARVEDDRTLLMRYSLQRVMKSVLLACYCSLFSCSLLAQETQLAEKIVDFSPDKKFAVRITYDPQLITEEDEKLGYVSRDAVRSLQLIAMPGKEVALDLGAEESQLEGKVVCSQDSKWLAYALSSGPRVTDTYVCRRVGNRFEEIKTEDLTVDAGGDVRNEYVKPLRWLKPGTLLLEQFAIFRGDAGDSTVQFAVRFDKQGKFKVTSKKKIRSKQE